MATVDLAAEAAVHADGVTVQIFTFHILAVGELVILKIAEQVKMKFNERLEYYEKQKLQLPHSVKIKSRIKELKYMQEEIVKLLNESNFAV